MQKREFIAIILFAMALLFLAGCQKTGKAFLGAADTSLVLYLPFNEGSGTTANDLSGKGNSGTIYGATYVDGISGKALSFDGIDDYIGIADAGLHFLTNGNLTAFTILAWVKTNDTRSSTYYYGEAVISKTWPSGYNDMSLAIGPSQNGKLRFHYGSSEGRDYYSSTGANNDNQWHLVGIQRDINGNFKFIRDGVFDGGFIDATNVPNHNSEVRIGEFGRGDASGYNFYGLIDEVLVYNRALSASEVQEMYNAYAPSSNVTDATTGCPNNLCAYYKFDEGAGTTAADASGSGNTGAIYGATYVDGVAGKALSFDGVDDYIDVASILSGDGTFEAWVHPKRYDGDVVSSGVPGNDFRIAVKSSGSSYYGFYIGSEYRVVTTLKPPLNEWTHLTLVWDSSGTRLYFNGIFQAQNTATPPAFSPTGINIGRYKSPAQLYFNGLIDEVRIWNRSLSALEVQQLYNAYAPSSNVTDATTGCPNNLCAYYKFDEGSGSVLQDNSGNNNSGTIYGATYVDGKAGKALSFDGNDYVKIPNSPELKMSGDITFGAWLKWNSWPNDHDTFIEKGTHGGSDVNYIFGKGASDVCGSSVLKFSYKVGGRFTDVCDSSGWTATLGSWYHIALVVDKSGGKVYFYMNGALKSSRTASLNYPTNDEDLTMGLNTALYEGFDGVMDEFLIYDKALSATEIQQLYGAVNMTAEKTINISTNASINNTCTETDQGRYDYNTKGRVYGTEWGNPFDKTDECVSEIMLREYYCASTGEVSADAYNCTYGCQNGACLNATTPVNITCTDTDGGKNYYVRGYAVLSNSFTQYWDSCSLNSNNTWYLYETYCENNQVKTETVSCPYGCKKEEQMIAGSYYGACLNATTPVNITCADSDGGLNYNTKGTATSGSGSSTDTCDPYMSGNRTLLKEYFCSSTNQIDAVSYNCPNSCQDGACIQNVTLPPTNESLNITCTDSDGGLNYYVKGNVNYGSGDVVSTVSDICTSAIINGTMKSNVLREYFCTSANEVDYEHYQCPVGNCKEGACVSAAGNVNCLGTSIIGDANRDGTITPGDALLIANIALGIEPMPANKCCVDVDNNGIINRTDSKMAFNYYLGLTPSGNAGKKCYEVRAQRGILAKTGQAFGLGETSSSGAFGLAILVALIAVIYFLVKGERKFEKAIKAGKTAKKKK